MKPEPRHARVNLWRGLELPHYLRLLALRPPVRAARLPRLLSLAASSAANSLLHALEVALFSRRVRAVRLDPAPVFILGHWRSGTTLLHNLLAFDSQFTCPTHYQCRFPGHFLLTERWVTRLTGGRSARRRPMDAMPLTWGTPEEDEHALLLLTLRSPYLAATFPGRTHEPRIAARLGRPAGAELDQWTAAFLQFLRKVAHRRPGRLVLKSPPHTARLPVLLRLFPNAQFIYLVRYPYEVFASTRHMRQILERQNNFTGTVPSDLDESIFQTYQQLYEAYHLFRPLIPAGQLCEMRYEDLEADPLAELRRLYEVLGWRWHVDVESRIREWLPQHRDYRKNTYVLDEPLRQQVAERWKGAFRRYGYDVGTGTPPTFEQSPLPVTESRT